MNVGYNVDGAVYDGHDVVKYAVHDGTLYRIETSWEAAEAANPVTNGTDVRAEYGCD
ncbi:hypothetical protein [Haloarchaeobius sp. DT45]|uniref:hypothetical protein n=1 Tax=Haloarchaeobius sp. DT45 TaxID=3446116 RepID=UPI003F6B10D7